MKRTIDVGLAEDDNGAFFDREDAERKLAFLLDCCEHFGGGFSVAALRDELPDGSYVLVGLRINYDSYVPARRVEPVEPLEEPVPA